MSDIKSGKIDDLRRKIDEMVLFLNEMSPLSNAHMVDFIVDEHWKLLDRYLQKDLLNLPDDEMDLIISDTFLTLDRRKKFPHLYDFISRANKFTIKQLDVCKNINDISSEFKNSQINFVNNLKNINWSISEKKQHEVQKMAFLISSLTKSLPIDLVIDIGSGKGYLSTYIALFLHLNVLGIEACEKKCKSANIRNTKLTNMLTNKINTYEENSDCKDCTYENIPLKNEENITTDKYKKDQSSKFISVAIYINTKSDLENIITQALINKSSKHPSKFYSAIDCKEKSCINNEILLCGLHTCGNLSSTLIHHFVSCKMVRILCNVGCCYNLLIEELYDEKSKLDENMEIGFPLSTSLKEAKFSLGRNARMLASQCQERTIKNKEFHLSLFYRALLQVMLSHYSNVFSSQNSKILEFQVGRVSKNCQSFNDYVNKALKNLNSKEINIDVNNLENYLHAYSAYEKKLKAFQLLRIILAPCIETLILLDRLLYLWEQDCTEEAYIVCLFDSVISPRCYGIVAIKKTI